MPYVVKGKCVYKKDGTKVGCTKGSVKKYLAALHAAEKKKKRWSRKVDKKMKDYGEIDYDKKRIRVNPAKGELVDTVLHEELHKRYPSKTEKQIKVKAKQRQKHLTIRGAMKLLKKYL